MRRCGATVAALVLASSMVGAGPPSVAAESNSWCGDLHAFTSTVSLPAGFWTPGMHAATWDWPDVYGTNWGSFEVQANAPLYEGYVWIWGPPEPGGPAYLEAYGPTHVEVLNPAQRTIIADVAVASRSELDILIGVHNETSQTMAWDGGPAVAAHFSGIASGCTTGGPNKQTSFFLRNRGGRP